MNLNMDPRLENDFQFLHLDDLEESIREELISIVKSHATPGTLQLPWDIGESDCGFECRVNDVQEVPGHWQQYATAEELKYNAAAGASSTMIMSPITAVHPYQQQMMTMCSEWQAYPLPPEQLQYIPTYQGTMYNSSGAEIHEVNAAVAAAAAAAASQQAREGGNGGGRRNNRNNRNVKRDFGGRPGNPGGDLQQGYMNDVTGAPYAQQYSQVFCPPTVYCGHYDFGGSQQHSVTGQPLFFPSQTIHYGSPPAMPPRHPQYAIPATTIPQTTVGVSLKNSRQPQQVTSTALEQSNSPRNSSLNKTHDSNNSKHSYSTTKSTFHHHHHHHHQQQQQQQHHHQQNQQHHHQQHQPHQQQPQHQQNQHRDDEMTNNCSVTVNNSNLEDRDGTSTSSSSMENNDAAKKAARNHVNNNNNNNKKVEHDIPSVNNANGAGNPEDDEEDVATAVSGSNEVPKADVPCASAKISVEVKQQNGGKEFESEGVLGAKSSPKVNGTVEVEPKPATYTVLDVPNKTGGAVNGIAGANSVSHATLEAPAPSQVPSWANVVQKGLPSTPNAKPTARVNPIQMNHSPLEGATFASKSSSPVVITPRDNTVVAAAAAASSLGVNQRPKSVEAESESVANHTVENHLEAKCKLPLTETLQDRYNDPTVYRMGEFLLNYQMDKQTVSLLPRGLTNRSNYCYINSILQALLACPPFYNLLMALPHSRNTSKNSLTPLIDNMVKFVNEFNPLSEGARLPRKARAQRKSVDAPIDIQCGVAFEPSYVYTMLKNTSSAGVFSVEGRQEDAEEFLSCLLNGISDEMLELMKLVNNDQSTPNNVDANVNYNNGEEEWKVMGPKNKGSITRCTEFGKTPLSDIFRGQLRSRVSRAEEQPTDNVQPFFTLQLDIEKAESVKGALEILVGRDQLEGMTCSKTKQQIEAWKQVTLEELPVILILHLKWFDYKLDGCSKIVKSVEFPVDLKLDPKFMSATAQKKLNGKQRQYKLFAVTYHDGKEATKGHYVTDAFHVGYGEWVRYDDSSVKGVTEENVLNPIPPRVPYLLYYRRCDTIGNNPPNNTVRKR